MSWGISLDHLQVSYINKLNVVVNTETRTFASHSTRMRGSPGASVSKCRKQTSYYGFRISCCHDCMILERSRTLSISVHSPTQVPQMKPIAILIHEMPNLNIRDH